MRLRLLLSATATCLLALPAVAQTPPAPPAAPASAPAPAGQPAMGPGTVIATVNGQPIHMSDIQDEANNLPAQLQQLPPEQLYPLLVSQAIDRRALLAAAQAAGLPKDPAIAAQVKQAADEKLENLYVQQKVAPDVSDAAVQAEYQKNYAGKPGAPEVQARHILVKTKPEAQDIIDQLNKGADFGKLAQKYSIDPGAKNGGELGWFTQDQMVPAFADAAFALKPGTYTKTPVQSPFGWHVILSEGKRQTPPPAFADVKDQIRQNLADAAVKSVLADARSKVKIVVNSPAGGPAGGTPPAATPVPAPAPAPAPSPAP